MSKPTITKFSNRTGSPFNSNEAKVPNVVHEEVLKTNHEIQKEKNSELLQKANKKTAEYQAHKPSSGVFTEVVAHGAFTSKKVDKEKSPKPENAPMRNNGNGKSLLGFPSSANDLALDAKSDLESDPNISKEVKEKVIEKLFALVSMCQHTYESKVRIMTEFEKFKDTHLKNEIRREREHSEQLYKLNMNFQNEVVQTVQQLKSELDMVRNFSNSGDSGAVSLKDSISYDTSMSLTMTDNSKDNVIPEELNNS